MQTRKLSSLAGVVLILLALTATGCPEQNTIASLTDALGNAAANIATLEGNSTLAAKLKTDTAAAVTAVKNWKKGTPAQEAIEALNLVEDDLNLIPGTSQYAPLITLAIGTVESILALLPPPSGGALSPHAARPHVQLSQPAPKNKSEFKAQWNSVIASHPNLAQAKI